jgi:YidC/Oxa1 family membrane protein insertase
LAVLHGVYRVVPNYGVAIIALTVLVRLCMFPISLKQAHSSQKMQLIQPELKKIQEKYKNDLEGRGRAMRELYKKHNFHPASGCLPLFLQLPIFIGLYRALMVDVELRQAPLISESVFWASNAAAPDMLWDWSAWMPNALQHGAFLIPALGPYLNILPLITVALYLVQQKVMMPPALDDQARMQQKMMKYMMIFIGVMFYRVASGLCLYFIASTLWSLGERRFLPKPAPPGQAPATPAPPPAPASQKPSLWSFGRDDGAKKKKKKPRRR